MIAELGERWADEARYHAASAVGVSLPDSSNTTTSKPSFWKAAF